MHRKNRLFALLAIVSMAIGLVVNKSPDLFRAFLFVGVNFPAVRAVSGTG
ncbi:hypothetical Protein YC6258_04317 [Gynuella sunshinyii YC6258]|uniref:Uncharacterized protein n=1 Tax=Gynuella sunshinyii YC6258 TaxID=1445510 RepID=A0A0C5VQ29_9GAMM|nr:hypothetical Protein YC6258_04317 [Gynuella sunshinyii YC6258]